jgi:hypothetical protein
MNTLIIAAGDADTIVEVSTKCDMFCIFSIGKENRKMMVFRAGDFNLIDPKKDVPNQMLVFAEETVIKRMNPFSQ